MVVNYPTVEEVKQAFADAILSSDPFDQERWDRLYRAVMAPIWQPANDGIEILQANGARLVRVRWEFAIDKMNTSSEADLQSSAAALRQHLLALVNGERSCFDTPKSATTEGPVTTVKCWTQVIIG